MKVTLALSSAVGAVALWASTFAPTFAAPVPAVRSTGSVKATQNAPHFVLYSDKWTNMGLPPTSAVLGEWNVFALSFWLSSGAADMALGWTQLTADQRSSIKSDYAANGKKLIVAAFGATETPTSSNADPKGTADKLAAFVKQWGLDGVDVDYEDFAAVNGGTAEEWLITFTNELRSQLPANQYIITHAPVAPWFRNDGHYPGGGYLKVNSGVGSAIDWYNIQFYNQGTSGYTSCDDLLNNSSAAPNTSLFQIAAAGVDQSKLVIGKPANIGDQNNGGYMDPSALATCVSQAKSKGWNAGLMLWQYPDEPANFLSTVWGS